MRKLPMCMDLEDTHVWSVFQPLKVVFELQPLLERCLWLLTRSLRECHDFICHHCSMRHITSCVIHKGVEIFAINLAKLCTIARKVTSLVSGGHFINIYCNWLERSTRYKLTSGRVEFANYAALVQQNEGKYWHLFVCPTSYGVSEWGNTITS